MSKSRSYEVTGTAAVKIAEAAGPQQETFMISVESGEPITIGGPEIEAGKGITLTAAQAAMPITMNGDELFAICAAGRTAQVAVISVVSGPVT